MAPEPAFLRCPRDGAPLLPRSFSGIDFQFCRSCDGILLPREQLQAIALRAAGGLGSPRSHRRRDAVVHEGTARCVCPGAPLMTTLESHGVTLDACAACGSLWLDGGELRKVVESYVGRPTSKSVAISSGGAGDTVWVGDVCELVFGLLEAVGEVIAGLLLH